MWFRRRSRQAVGAETDDDYELAAPNVPADWAAGDDWLTWEPPRDFVAGESHYVKALRALTGEPREDGYLRPVEVRFVREPDNAYDANAWRAEVEGKLIGYVRREIAAQMARPLDDFGCSTFSVCGVLRGGWIDAPNVGVHVWLDKRTTPGPELSLADHAREVAWPPHSKAGAYCSHDEGQAAKNRRRG
jgi:hypothetical protein